MTDFHPTPVLPRLPPEIWMHICGCLHDIDDVHSKLAMTEAIPALWRATRDRERPRWIAVASIRNHHFTLAGRSLWWISARGDVEGVKLCIKCWQRTWQFAAASHIVVAAAIAAEQPAVLDFMQTTYGVQTADNHALGVFRTARTCTMRVSPQLTARYAVKVAHLPLGEDVKTASKEAGAWMSNRDVNVALTLLVNANRNPPTLVVVTRLEGTMTLRDHMRQFASVESATRIAKSLVDVLGGYMWRNQLVHGDIRPENIHFDAHGGPLLGNYQVLRAANDLHFKGDGIRPYTAPERLFEFHSDEYALCSDVYSMGVVLFELFERRLPRRPTSTRERRTLWQLAFDRTPQRLRPALLGMLQPNPTRRMHARDARRLALQFDPAAAVDTTCIVTSIWILVVLMLSLVVGTTYAIIRFA